MQKVITILIISIFTLSLGINFAFAQTATDIAGQNLQDAVNEAYGGGSDVAIDENTFNNAIIEVVNTLLTFTAVIFLGILIYGGWLWMSARGNEEQVDKAKKIIRQVVIGLIIIILARLFTQFILFQLEAATKAPAA